MNTLNTPCPECQSPHTYPMSVHIIACPECGYEWNPDDVTSADEQVVKDMYGNILEDGDTVIVMKDLSVKGSPTDLKSGTKVKNITLTDGDHNIDCRIDGFGKMALKSEFVKKA